VIGSDVHGDTLVAGPRLAEMLSDTTAAVISNETRPGCEA
jgi:hypothetical protein